MQFDFRGIHESKKASEALRAFTDSLKADNSQLFDTLDGLINKSLLLLSDDKPFIMAKLSGEDALAILDLDFYELDPEDFAEQLCIHEARLLKYLILSSNTSNYF